MPAYQAAIVPLLSRLQLMHIKTNLGTSPAVLAAPSPPGTPASAVPPPQWQSYDYVLKGMELPPQALAPILNQPGIRVSKLALRAGEWTIEGVIYVK